VQTWPGARNIRSRDPRRAVAIFVSELLNLSSSTVVKGAAGFCVALDDGRLPLDGDHPLGLYREDCRHLRGYELRLAGVRPRLLVAFAVGSTAVYELTNPALTLPDGLALDSQRLRVRVERQIDAQGMVDRIVLRSYAAGDLTFDLEFLLDADFRPMLEIRELVAPHARDVRRTADGDGLRFAAIGLDGRERWTLVRADGATATERHLLMAVKLSPGATRVVELEIAIGDERSASCERPTLPDEAPLAVRDGAAESGLPDDAAPVVPDGAAAQAPARDGPAHADGVAAERWLSERPRVDVDDQLVDRVLRRSLLDLRLLSSERDGHRYYAAGVPWYATLFGRDALITALQTIAFDPAMAADTLRLLARHLGARRDDEHDEEPGKVLHELRVGELADVGLTPLTRYYGSVDSTPLFLCLLCEHAGWSGSLELFRELRVQVEVALRWIDEEGDLDGDGLLEYRCRSSKGLPNQGWKDSHDGIVDEHGALLRAPIALVEVQGYALRAKRRLAQLYELDGQPARAGELRAGAARLARGIERFWLEDRGCYAMALDADKRPSRALASNQGHLLWSLAVPPQRAEAIRDALMSDGAYSGWGVRTLGSGERAYNPIGYHTGTVWPHDTALLALGLRAYGFDAQFQRVFDGLLDAAASFPGYRLPELFAGYRRRPYESPVPYPVACSPQAWAAGALPSMLTAGLGLIPDGLQRTLRIRSPSLPRDVSRLVVRGLRVADAILDLRFERAGRGAVALTDIELDGRLDVVVEPPAGEREGPGPTLAQVTGDPAARHA
jgi:glycogen debranching enzyme